jgi:hypothetical protein
LAGEARLLTLTNFTEFTRTSGATSGEVTLTSPELAAGFAWNELIVSWNASTNVALSIAARPLRGAETTYYSLGDWTSHPGPLSPRTSQKGQRSADGEVQTDTLVLKQPAEKAQVRVLIRGPENGLKRLSVAFSGTNGSTSNVTPFRAAWGVELPVPVRSQADYPEGLDKWCSPTSTAMLLTFWGEEAGRPDWIHSVPETAQAVFDPGWEGTGNWPFNMAFAGSHPGLNAAVARFTGIPDLEQWIAAGLPAAASVSYVMLKGGTQPVAGDGHLVVVRGFTREGDIIVNDPGVRHEKVRRVFPRADFERGWDHSNRTVYLVWPDGHRLPEGSVFPK